LLSNILDILWLSQQRMTTNIGGGTFFVRAPKQATHSYKCGLHSTCRAGGDGRQPNGSEHNNHRGGLGDIGALCLPESGHGVSTAIFSMVVQQFSVALLEFSVALLEFNVALLPGV